MSLPAISSPPVAKKSSPLLQKSSLASPPASYSDRLALWRDERIATLRSWREFGELARFSWPTDGSVARVRMGRNLQYYQTNYLLIALVLLAYCMYTLLAPSTNAG